MQQILSQNTSILTISSHLSETMDISDRLLVVENGICTAEYEKDEFHQIVR